MPDETPLADRSDERIMDDIIACLGIVRPQWFDWFDETSRVMWVRQQLDDMEANAREHGRGETGCMIVEYDADEKVMRWSVLVAYRYEDDESDPSPAGGPSLTASRDIGPGTTS